MSANRHSPSFRRRAAGTGGRCTHAMAGSARPPCSCLTVATQHYTVEDDGLQKSWYGHVWLNPPCGQEVVASGVRIRRMKTLTIARLMVGLGDMSNFAERVKRERKRLGMSQVQLAKALGVGWQTIHRWEHGHPPQMPQAVVMLLRNLKPLPKKMQRFNKKGRPPVNRRSPGK